MDEFTLIERFFRNQTVRRDDVAVRIGDDASILRPPSGQGLALSMDVMVEGVHFRKDARAFDVGHKALAVNLSDMAAVGAQPAWVLLGLTMPEVQSDWLEGFCKGFFALAEQHNVELVGGDLSRGPLNISVQVTGLIPNDTPLGRGGARCGHLIYVSGTLGDAALGLKVAQGELSAEAEDERFFLDSLNRPSPRVALGLGLTGLASSAIDLSDGLLSDLGHVCDASGVGAVIDIDRLPLSEAYRRYLTRVELAPALCHGDDYEICFTVKPERRADIEALAKRVGVSLSCIGVMEGKALELQRDGVTIPLTTRGFRHFS